MVRFCLTFTLADPHTRRTECTEDAIAYYLASWARGVAYKIVPPLHFFCGVL